MPEIICSDVHAVRTAEFSFTCVRKDVTMLGPLPPATSKKTHFIKGRWEEVLKGLLSPALCSMCLVWPELVTAMSLSLSFLIHKNIISNTNMCYYYYDYGIWTYAYFWFKKLSEVINSHKQHTCRSFLLFSYLNLNMVWHLGLWRLCVF